MSTKIEWTSETWNPVRGCARVSPGCEHCYAERQARRHDHPGGAYEGLTELTRKGPRWNGKVLQVAQKLEEPLHWRKPRRVFVNSMSDLFHEGVHDWFIAAVFGVMAAARQHTFQILTKRPERMRDWFRWVARDPAGLIADHAIAGGVDDLYFDNRFPGWPLPNVWIGVSVEDQLRADQRLPILRECPSAVHWVSAEPLLGLTRLHLRGIDWVVVGGESGPGARICEKAWIAAIVDQCVDNSVPVFVKQLGARSGGPGPILLDRKGGDINEWPLGLQIRQYP